MTDFSKSSPLFAHIGKNEKSKFDDLMNEWQLAHSGKKKQSRMSLKSKGAPEREKLAKEIDEGKYNATDEDISNLDLVTRVKKVKFTKILEETKRVEPSKSSFGIYRRSDQKSVDPQIVSEARGRALAMYRTQSMSELKEDDQLRVIERMSETEIQNASFNPQIPTARKNASREELIKSIKDLLSSTEELDQQRTRLNSHLSLLQKAKEWVLTEERSVSGAIETLKLRIDRYYADNPQIAPPSDLEEKINAATSPK